MEINQNSVKIASIFDYLRIQKSMSLEEFTSDIVSIRQFRRFLNGEYKINPEIFNQLSMRLGFKPEHMLLYVHHDSIKENDLIKKFYNFVANKDFESANTLLFQIGEGNMLDYDNKLLLKYALYFKSYYQKEISQDKLYDYIYNLIDFNKLIKQTVFTSTEIIILTSLLSFEAFDQKEKIISLLSRFIDKHDFVIGYSNERIYALCLYYLSQFNLEIQNYTDAITYALKGINFCCDKKISYLIEDYFFYAACAFKKINDTDNLNLMLSKLYFTLKAEDNAKKTDKYFNLVKDSFNIDLKELIKLYI